MSGCTVLQGKYSMSRDMVPSIDVHFSVAHMSKNNCYITYAIYMDAHVHSFYGVSRCLKLSIVRFRYLIGLLNTSYAEKIGPLSFVASLAGVTVLGRYVKKSGKASIIVYILGSLITVGKASICVVIA
jgi:hypothetical protein